MDECDPACAMPRIKEWLEVVTEMEEREGRRCMFNAKSNMCVAELDDVKMDEYLKLCERGLLGKEKGDVLERYFPLVEKVKQEDGEDGPALRILRATAMSEACLRPGEGYKTGEVDEEMVFRRGVGSVGGCDIIGRIVCNFESRIIGNYK